LSAYDPVLIQSVGSLNPIDSPSMDFVMSFLNLDTSNGLAKIFSYRINCLLILSELEGLSSKSGQVSAI
jgi:hypothetical protein